jgi:hypothetical protein
MTGTRRLGKDRCHLRFEIGATALTARQYVIIGLTALLVTGSTLTAARPAHADPPAETAQAALAAFEKSTKPGVWNLKKKDIVAGIFERLYNPYAIQQRNTPFCAPATVAFELARKRPLRYVQVCQNLFETGGFDGQAKRYSASQDLRQRPVGGAMAPVDWMLLATLKASTGTLEDGVSEVESMEWAREVLGCRNVRFEPTFWWGEESALEKAATVVKGGGVAFIAVSKQLLTGEWTWWAEPDHAVALADSSVVIEHGTWEDHFRFHVYDPASDKYGPVTVNVGEGAFEDYFWGVITGEMPSGDPNGEPNLEGWWDATIGDGRQFPVRIDPRSSGGTWQWHGVMYYYGYPNVTAPGHFYGTMAGSTMKLTWRNADPTGGVGEFTSVSENSLSGWWRDEEAYKGVSGSWTLTRRAKAPG